MKIKIIFTLIFFIFTTQLLLADNLEIMTENFPPFNYAKDGKISGIVTKVVKEIQRRVGDKSEITLYSWNKAYNLAKTKPNKVLYSMAKTKIREPLFKWVGPVIYAKGYFYKNKDVTRRPKDIDDIKNNFFVGARENSNIHQNFIREGYKHIVPVANAEAYYKGVAYKRIDLLIASPYNIPLRAKKYGLDASIFENTGIQAGLGQLSIAFSKNTDDKIVKKWQKAFEEIKNDGTLQKLVKEGVAEAEKDFNVKFNLNEF